MSVIIVHVVVGGGGARGVGGVGGDVVGWGTAWRKGKQLLHGRRDVWAVGVDEARVEGGDRKRGA